MNLSNDVVIGYVIADKFGNYLLFEPTCFDVFNVEETTSPFVWDIGSYTVFRSKFHLQQMFEAWKDSIGEMDYQAIPLIGHIEEAPLYPTITGLDIPE